MDLIPKRKKATYTAAVDLDSKGVMQFYFICDRCGYKIMPQILLNDPGRFVFCPSCSARGLNYADD